MKKTKLTRSLLAACSIVALSVVLSGCLHSSDDSTTDTTMDMPTPVAVSLPGNVPAGMAPSGTHTIAAGGSATSNGVTFTCAAGGDACTVTVAADGGSATSTGGTVTATLSAAAQTAIDNAQAVADADKKKADDAVKANSATAKALKAAIDVPKTLATDGTTALRLTTPGTVVTPTSIPALDVDGLAATDVDTAAITLEKGDAVGMLAGWAGTDYAGDEGPANAKNTGMVRVYNNQEAPKRTPFNDRSNPSGLTYVDASEGYTVAVANNANIKSAALPSSGTTTLTGNARTFTGTFMGASGTYVCTGAGADDCTIDKEGIGPGAGTWVFKPASGAVVETPDAQYMQFGWWMRSDKDDDPTHAGVFYGGVGFVGPIGDAPATRTGKATYAGAAAGKFAISNPINPAGDMAGHFTADAALEADFQGVAGVFLSGTIDNFRLNDGSDDPGWSVALQKNATAVEDGSFGMAENGTVWSISGVATPAAGNWEARLYADDDDSNTTPRYAAGAFSSSIGATHSMVGAFGAEKQ